jgi:hypothetical protein
VGLLAPAVALAFAHDPRGHSRTVALWNMFGIADLIVAVGTGFLTSPSPFQMLALDRPNELISAFPLVLVPTFLVPLSVLLHLASLTKLGRDDAKIGTGLDCDLSGHYASASREDRHHARSVT